MIEGQGHRCFGMSDDGNYRKPTILQVVYWKKTGRIFEGNGTKTKSRVDITGPIGNKIGRQICLGMLNSAVRQLQQSPIYMVIYNQNYVENRLRMNNIFLGQFPYNDEDHEMLQLVDYHDHEDIDIVTLCRDKMVLLNMIERSRQFLNDEVINVVPAVPHPGSILDKIINSKG